MGQHWSPLLQASTTQSSDSHLCVNVRRELHHNHVENTAIICSHPLMWPEWKLYVQGEKVIHRKSHSKPHILSISKPSLSSKAHWSLTIQNTGTRVLNKEALMRFLFPFFKWAGFTFSLWGLCLVSIFQGDDLRHKDATLHCLSRSNPFSVSLHFLWRLTPIHRIQPENWCLLSWLFKSCSALGCTGCSFVSVSAALAFLFVLDTKGWGPWLIWIGISVFMCKLFKAMEQRCRETLEVIQSHSVSVSSHPWEGICHGAVSLLLGGAGSDLKMLYCAAFACLSLVGGLRLAHTPTTLTLRLLSYLT
jgi:hypothetical protein